MESSKLEQSQYLVICVLLFQATVAVFGGGLAGWVFPPYDGFLLILVLFGFSVLGVTSLFLAISRLWRNGYRHSPTWLVLFLAVLMQPVLYYGMTSSVRFFDVMGDISRFNSNFVRYSAIMRAVNNRQWKQGHYYVGLNDGGIQLDVTDATRVELDWFGFAGVWESIIYDPTDKLVKINGRASVSKKKASTMVWGDYHLTYCKHIRNHYYICDLD